MLKTLISVVLATAAAGVLAQAPKTLDAGESDPLRMGWMVGSPPPPDKLVLWANGSMFAFPRTRWAFAHIRQLVPTSGVWRGEGAVAELPRAERKDIDALTFIPLGKTEPMTWEQSLAANFTDSIVVLHKGKIVYERYFGVMAAQQPHIAMSVTKSFFGTLASMLVAEGKLDANAPVSQYIPELAQSAFGDATVRQVMDMTVGVKYSENYADPKAEIWDHMRAGNVLPRPPGYAGPKSFYAFLMTLQKEGEHGQAFAYKTVNADVLGWLIRRVTGQSVGEVLATRVWQKLGVERDGYLAIDTEGSEFAGGGFNLTTRDLARFGEMMRLDGRYNGQQIVPKAVVDGIRAGGDKALFAKAGFALLPGWSYRDQWWVTNNAHGAYMARGVHGQAIYIDPQAQVVIARFGSHPLAANANFDPTSLPAFEALAALLMR